MIATAVALREPELPVEDFADPHDYAAACRAQLVNQAEVALTRAGHDVEDEEVCAELDDAVQHRLDLEQAALDVAYYGRGFGEELAMAAAWSRLQANARPAAPAPPPACVPRLRMRGRSRQARCGAPRRAGSRRGASPGSDPDDEPGPSSGRHVATPLGGVA